MEKIEKIQAVGNELYVFFFVISVGSNWSGSEASFLVCKSYALAYLKHSFSSFKALL